MRADQERTTPGGHRLPVTLLAAAFVALAAWSWRRWPDLLVDFGQQLYIPWRLAAGDRLYTDIAFLHGPLSQHLNALAFRLFGASLTTIVALNLAILAALAAGVYAWLAARHGRLTAFAATLAMLTLFGFAQFVGVGNYNFICPYTQEATHGLVTALAATALLSRYAERGGTFAAGLAGFLLGLTLLTKADVALAATAAALLAIPAILLSAGRAGRRPLLDASLFAAALLVPPGASALLLSGSMSFPMALRAAASGFLLPGTGVAENPFYLHVLGLDDPWGNALHLLVMAALLACLILAAAALDIALAKRGRIGPASGLAAGLLAFLLLVVFPNLIPWRELPRALPMVSLTALVLFSARFLARRRRGQEVEGLVPMILWSGLASALLGKVFLHTHLYHYGFYLALPATLLMIVAALFWLPAALRARAGDGRIFRGLACGFLAAGIAYHLRWSNEFYRLKDLEVGRGGDRILTYGEGVDSAGAATAEALRWIDTNVPPGATFAAIPEGIMLNYLSRRATSSPCINFMRAEMSVFGEARMLAGLKARPPDFVLLVHKDRSEFGPRFFAAGPGEGRSLLDWVGANYTRRVLFGQEPAAAGQLGIEILARNVEDGRPPAPGPAAGAAR